MGLVSLLRKTNRKTLFTTPSHSQRFFIFHKLRNLYRCDISETETHNPEAELIKSEKYAARIYKTTATKYLTNGSTSGVIASVLACTKKGDKVLLWDNAHPCHKNAVILAGASPVFYELPVDEEWGVVKGVTNKILEPFLAKNDIKAVIITSPTYEGFVSNIREIKSLCEKYNSYLIVDEAHGALYPFCEDLPDSAVNIADFTVQSLHKTAGGLNPTALLHTNTNLNINDALTLINTTSPSYPILASIEANINYLNSKRGRKRISDVVKLITDLRRDCAGCTFGGDDITKILVKIEGISGFKLSDILFNEYNIEDEKTNDISTMLLCGIGTDESKIKRLKSALKSIVKKCNKL